MFCYHENVTEKRASPRVPVRLRVNIFCRNRELQSSQAITNISLGGVYVELSEPIPFGSEIDMIFELPDGIFECAGTVVRVESGERPGIGVRLTRVEISDLRRMRAYIDQRLPSVAPANPVSDSRPAR